MRRTLLAIAVLVALSLLASPPARAAATELKPFKASYTINWRGVSAGTVELVLEQLPDGRWSYNSHTTARGLFRLAMPANVISRSIFQIQQGQLVPQQFISDDGARSDEHRQRLNFDWQTGRVTGLAAGKPVDLPTQPGLLDTLSVQVALMNELLSGRTPARFVLVDEDVIKDYLYTAEGRESLRTSVGEHQTTIYRSSRPGSKKGTLFWCAPELGYVPLKVERRDGKNVEWSMTLRSLQRD